MSDSQKSRKIVSQALLAVDVVYNYDNLENLETTENEVLDQNAILAHSKMILSSQEIYDVVAAFSAAVSMLRDKYPEFKFQFTPISGVVHPTEI
jgi:hypothetical protein